MQTRCEICHKSISGLEPLQISVTFGVVLQYISCKACGYKLREAADLINYKLEEQYEKDKAVESIDKKTDGQAERGSDRSGSGLLQHRAIAGAKKEASKTAGSILISSDKQTG